MAADDIPEVTIRERKPEEKPPPQALIKLAGVLVIGASAVAMLFLLWTAALLVSAIARTLGF